MDRATFCWKFLLKTVESSTCFSLKRDIKINVVMKQRKGAMVAQEVGFCPVTGELMADGLLVQTLLRKSQSLCP